MAEQAEAFEAERVGHLEHVGDEALEGVGRRRIGGRIVRSVAGAVAAMVDDDHGVVDGERGHVVREVFLGAPEPVHEQQARPAPRDVDCELHPVVHLDAHPTMLTHGALRAPHRP